MDFKEKICKVCGDIKKLINCPHTHPLCLYKNSILTGVMPFSHPLIASETEPKPSGTEESKKPKVKKPTKPAEPGKSPKPTEDQLLNSWVAEFHPRPVHHRCSLKARKQLVSTSLSSEAEADSPSKGSETARIDQDSTSTEKSAKQAKVDGGKRPKIGTFELKNTSADPTGKNGRKQRASESDSDDSTDLTTESIRAKRRRLTVNTGRKQSELNKFLNTVPTVNDYQVLLLMAKSYESIRECYNFEDSTEASQVLIPTADDIGVVQLENLPISTTVTQGNSVENQLELGQNGNDVEENNLNSVAISSESAKSDSSDELDNHPSETPDDDDIDLAISKLADRFDKTLAEQQLPQIIYLMRNNMENSRVLLRCQQLISRYSYDLWPLGSSLLGSLIDILLSVMKQHCHNSEIEEKFSTLAKRLLIKISVDRNRFDIDWFVACEGAIDFLLEIGCGENNLTTLVLLDTIFGKSNVDQRNSKLSVETICQSIRHQLQKPKCDMIMLIRCRCLPSICDKSVANQKKFLNANGISLIQECLEWDYNGCLRNGFNNSIFILMEGLSDEKSILAELMAKGNPEILWQMWRDPSCHEIRPFCRRIFANFLSESPPIWPFAHPTVEEVKIQLRKEGFWGPKAN